MIKFESKKESQIRPLYLPAEYHRKLKSFCALEEVDMKEAMAKAIDVFLEVYAKQKKSSIKVK